MYSDTRAFLSGLLACNRPFRQPAFLTLTAIHPDGNWRTPSRHIPTGNQSMLDDALQRLFVANQMGWGAYVAIGLRKSDLGRWRRGGNADVLALPALYADVDHPDSSMLKRIRDFKPPPSCIVFTSGGYHIYWWLADPLRDLHYASRLLRTISKKLDGDSMSVSQSLRIPGSANTKRSRNRALCRIVEINQRRYRPENFKLPPEKPIKPFTTLHALHGNRLNPVLIQVVTDILYQEYSGFERRNGWLGAICPAGHRRDAPGKHFSFKPGIGLGVCQGRHGRLLLKDLCQILNLFPNDYGGLYEPTQQVHQNRA